MWFAAIGTKSILADDLVGKVSLATKKKSSAFEEFVRGNHSTFDPF
jgi:hypothetical protein